MIKSRARRNYRFWALLLLKLAFLAFTLLLLGTLVARCAPGTSGQDLVESECTRCHTLAPIEAETRSRAEWEDVVYEMIERGADLNEQEVETVVDYLAENYGPGDQ